MLSALVGSGTAFFMPGLTGLIPQIVSPERLRQANALNGLSFSIGGIIGPSVAGVIVATTSPGWAILADALSYVLSVASLAALHMGPAREVAPESFLSQLRRGWSEFWARSWLWSIVVGASFFNLVAMAPYFVLGAVVCKHSLGGATAWGTILGAQGVGAVVGGITMLRLHVKRPLVVGGVALLVWPFPLLALAYLAPVAVIAVGGFLGGASFAVFDTQWTTTMQREVPSEVLSRERLRLVRFARVPASRLCHRRAGRLGRGDTRRLRLRQCLHGRFGRRHVPCPFRAQHAGRHGPGPLAPCPGAR